MVVTINTEILNFIKNTDYDKNLQNFLIEAILLEFSRIRLDNMRYFDEYDKVVNKYVNVIK